MWGGWLNLEFSQGKIKHLGWTIKTIIVKVAKADPLTGFPQVKFGLLLLLSYDYAVEQLSVLLYFSRYFVIKMTIINMNL